MNAILGPWLVYFIKGEKTNLIKIGETLRNCPCRRFKEIQTHSPDKLEIIGTARGYRDRQLHKLFSKYRKHGEWFDFSEEIRNFIDKYDAKIVCKCSGEYGEVFVNTTAIDHLEELNLYHYRAPKLSQW